MGQQVTLTNTRTFFRVVDEGGDVVPGGFAWETATDVMRAAFWEILARWVRIRKDRELARGLGVSGSRLPPLRAPRTGRLKGFTGPPLMPRREFSRSRRNLVVTSSDDSVTGRWRSGWGRIVGYHARGLVRGAPVRDIVGLTDQGLRFAIRQARREWRELFEGTTLPPDTVAVAFVTDARGDRRLVARFTDQGRLLPAG